jgi:6-phosphogluconolactonase (cycloisomerase 2 family)
MTYEIDPTGRLHPPVTQRVGKDLNVLAGEPQGRFVYAAHGGWALYGSSGTGEGSNGTIVTYAPDPRDGTLAEVSEQTVFERPRGGLPSGPWADLGGWSWLKGSANRVHAFWSYRWGTTGRHTTYSYVSVGVASDGHLGPVRQLAFESDADPGQVMVDARSDLLYKAGKEGYDGRGGLEAHLIEPDGTLTRMGWTNLCLASRIDLGYPLVTARGFVFASAYTPGPTVCSYQGLRLKPLYALDLNASAAEAFVPSSEAEPGLLAMNVTISTGGSRREELRVLSMNGEGDLRPVYSEELPDRITRLLFHPSGRFLYAVDAAARLRAYTVDSDGRLALTMSIDHAGGGLAITLKDARAQDR